MKHDRQTYPNPWDFHNDDKSLKSSDGRLKIEYYDLNEIAMGAPLGGKCFLIVDSKTKILIGDWCAGPAFWSAEESMIAIPIWERTFFKGTIQKLVVIDLVTGKVIRYKKDFSVLDIRGFENKIIYGYDSPIKKPKTIEFNIAVEKVESSNLVTEFILKTNVISGFQIVLSNDSDNDTFDKLAAIIESDLGLSFKEKISGLEQFYWDFEFKGEIFTLHLEHYLGIVVFPKVQNLENIVNLTKDLEQEIKKYWR